MGVQNEGFSVTVVPNHSLLAAVVGCLDDHKAEDIVTISLSGKSSFADDLVIATGRSSRQLLSTADAVTRRLREIGESVLGVEGMQQGDWVLIDAGTVVIHLFRPEIRSHYRLEEMWGMEVFDQDRDPFEATPASVGFS